MEENRMVKARIVGTGSYLPEKVLTNQDLERLVETSDEWIVSRTGMKERRLAGENEFTSDMGLAAAKAALADGGVEAADLDLVLCATLTPDYMFPSTACLIQTQLGAVHAGALDIQAACSGYLYALSIAKAYIESGMYKNILLVASEKLSSIVDYQDRATCVLFGDGATAAIISAEGAGLVISSVSIGADGEQAGLLMLPAGGSREPATEASVAARRHFLRMEGKETFKHAVRRMEAAAKDSLQRTGLTEEEIDWLVPHQANIRIIEAMGKRFAVPKERVYMTIEKYGNTSSSSIGIALDELRHKEGVNEGENVLLVAFGAGLTWGAAVLTQKDNG